jgi:hypothetical protein
MVSNIAYTLGCRGEEEGFGGQAELVSGDTQQALVDLGDDLTS